MVARSKQNVDKVKLSELDQSVLDEIKKNQEIILQIPAFSKEIVVSQATANIPNFYQIIVYCQIK